MHIIFDLDGTLLDTVFAFSKATAELLREKGCAVTTEEIFGPFGGLDAREKFKGSAALRGKNFSEEEYDAFVTAHEKVKHTLYTNAAAIVIDGVREMLEELHKQGHLLSLCSGSKTADAKLALQSAGLLHYFDDRIYGPDLVGGKSKPDPAIVLRALQDNPGLAVMVEDSLTGIASGKAAGTYVIARLDPRFGDDKTAAPQYAAFKKAGAAAIIRDYKDIYDVLPQPSPKTRIKPPSP